MKEDESKGGENILEGGCVAQRLMIDSEEFARSQQAEGRREATEVCTEGWGCEICELRRALGRGVVEALGTGHGRWKLRGRMPYRRTGSMGVSSASESARAIVLDSRDAATEGTASESEASAVARDVCVNGHISAKQRRRRREGDPGH